MALTPSNMMPLGTVAPDFNLLDPRTGALVSRDACQGDVATVVLFICNHCPYVQLIREAIAKLAQDYQSQGIRFLAINSNDVDNYPDDSPEKMAEMAQAFGFDFPYLYDETQAVAQAYQAACTPDCYVFDAHFRCVYRGQFDDARPGNDVTPTGADIRAALDALLNGQQPSADQKPSIGCNIKWKEYAK